MLANKDAEIEELKKQLAMYEQLELTEEQKRQLGQMVTSNKTSHKIRFFTDNFYRNKKGVKIRRRKLKPLSPVPQIKLALMILPKHPMIVELKDMSLGQTHWIK